MRILILTQYFTPEIGATSTRVHHFAAGLAARGHDVHVLCEVPNHPQGVVHPGYRGRPVIRKRLDGFHGHWLWVATKPEKTTRGRLAFYGTYAGMAVAWGSLLPRPDVILASSPPLPVAAAAAVLARRHRTPWVMDVRDLWPQAAVALGELSDGWTLRAAERLEAFLYRDAATVIAVTKPFIEHIARFVAGGRNMLVPNGTTRFWIDAGERPPDRQAAGLPEDRFVWAYAGNIGLGQDLGTAVEAAERLGHGFQLLILGDGAAKSRLLERAARLPPGRVIFRQQVGPDEAAIVLRACDALLVSLSSDPTLAAFVPSKLFDFCALSRPVLVAAAGEPQRLVREAGAGVPVAPGNSDELAAAVRRLRADSDLRSRLSDAGRLFSKANLRDERLDELASILARAARSERRSATDYLWRAVSTRR